MAELSSRAAVRGTDRLGGAAGVFVDLLDRHLTDASLRLDVDGRTIVCGARDPRGTALPGAVRLRVERRRFFSRVLGDGNLGMGEAFIDGDFTVEEGELHELLTALVRNRIDQRLRRDPRTLVRVLGVQAANLVRRHQWRHVQHHYDLGPGLFASFLDDTLTYSCGYAETTGDDLETMQRQKLDRICRKLELKRGESLLDIGCGYGGLLTFAARHYGVNGVGITNSRDHCRVGNERIAAAGVGDRVRLELRDHRTIDGRFDKVVSVGMLEHLPVREYRRYFDRIAKVLAPQGVALVHAIGCTAPRVEHDPFIQRYIFPGSGQMLLSDVSRELERHRMAIRDVENIARHYGYTVLHWLARFRKNAGSLDPVRYDTAFRRMWEYYFHCGIAGAFASDGAVYQVLFGRDYSAPVPLCRV